MADKTIRTIGATLVLFGIAVAAILQLGSQGDPSAIALSADDPSTTGAVETTEPQEGTDSSSSTVPEPFVYRVGVLANVSAPNFWAFYGADEPSVWDAYILGPTRSSLYTFDAASGTLTTQLATEEAFPKPSGDGWRVSVPLRDDYFWSDGQPLTAHDFVFTYETVRALELGGSWGEVFPATIEAMRADGEHSLVIEFADRPTLSEWPHGPGVAPIMARHIWADLAATQDSEALYAAEVGDVSGGPLRLERVEDSLATSSANPHHPESIGPDTVEYHVYPDEAAGVQAVVSGEVDTLLSPNGVADDLIEQVRDRPEISVSSDLANGIRYLGFNLSRQPMSEPAFRTALALLLDREAMTGTVARSFVSPANLRWFDEEAAAANAARYAGDLEARLKTAIEGLRAAGYAWVTEPAPTADGTVTPGVGLTIAGLEPAPLTILTPGDAYDPARPDHAASIARTLGWLGFDVRPITTDFDTVVDLTFTRSEEGLLQYDMYLLGWSLGSPALPAFYRPLFAPNGVMNNTGYSSEAFTAKLAAYEMAFEVDAARASLWEMESILNEDLPYLLLYPSQISEIYRNDHVAYGVESSLGGIQGRLGGLSDVTPAG